LGGTATAAQDLQATVPCRIGATVSNTNYFTGNLSNFRAIKGTALYTASFSPPTSPLTAISGTSFLTCQSTTFIDNSPNAIAITNTGSVVTNESNPFSGATTLLTGQSRLLQDDSVIPVAITPVGDARPTSANPFVTTNGIGGTSYSGFFDGTGDYLSGPASNSSIWPGSGNFTIEYWLYLPSNPGSTTYYNHFSYGTSGSVLRVFNTGATSKVEVFSGTSVILNPAWPGVGQWNHFALVRNGTTLTLYINGVAAQSVTNSTDFSTGTLTIGGEGASNSLLGYVSNFRIVKGTAVYTSNFSPSTTPLVAVSGTQLLTCQSTTFIDNSTNAFPISVSGNAVTNAFNPYSGATTLLTCQSTQFIDNSAIPVTITANGNATPERANPFTDTVTGPTPYAAATYGGSGYFDGSGDYLTFPQAALQFGTSDFTVEAWVYFTTIGTDQYIFNYASSGPTHVGINYYSGAWRIGGFNSYLVTGGSASTGQWYHVAMVRSANNLRAYINGAQIGSAVSVSGVTFSASGIGYIGAYYSTQGLNLNGYISNLRVITGTAVYTGPFVPPAAPVTAVSGTQLLVNGTNAGIFDNTTVNDLETIGSAQVSTSVVKYGTGSIYLNGLNSYLFGPNTPDLNFGSGNFTIEGWFYSISVATNGLISKWNDGGNQRGWKLDTQSAGTMTFYYSTTGSDFPVVTFSGASLDANTWTHLALVRNGSTLTLYKNGTSIGSSAFTATIFANNSQSCIGGWFVSTGTPQTVSVSPYNGYMDDVRVTKGVARYTANFTPPGGPFPNF
jgi:hypothetical protein